MNGPVNIYKTREIIRHDVDVLVPDGMYRMRNIHGEGPTTISTQMQEPRGNEPEVFALEARLRNIIQELDEIRNDMTQLKVAIVIDKPPAPTPPTLPDFGNVIVNASPTHVPYSILAFRKRCAHLFNLMITTHIHSTITSLPPQAENFANEFRPRPELPTVTLRLIWKDVGPSPELVVGHVRISGEGNIMRYFARLLPTVLLYETGPNTTDLDCALDIAYCLVRARTKTERASYLQGLSKKLGKSQFLCGYSEITVADIAAASAIKQVAMGELNQNMSKWIGRCEV